MLLQAQIMFLWCVEARKKKTSFCHNKHRHVVSPELEPKYSMTLDMLLNQLEKQFKW